MRLFTNQPTSPEGRIYVANGLGVNSVAMLCCLVEWGLSDRVAAIVTTDPGDEWRDSRRHLDLAMRPWCVRVGLPDPIIVTRGEEAQFRGPRAWRAKEGESLRAECVRTASLPSIAYGWKKCSQKFKAQVSLWWCERQAWCAEEWAAGRKIVKCIGYDVDEGRRVAGGLKFVNENENEKFVPWYPLHAAGIDREECEDIARRHGLPVPVHSACTFCPNNSREDWLRLHREEPEAFARAVEMSRGAKLYNPDVVGLMRCNPPGKRQLHVWVDGGYGDDLGPEITNEQPCECAT